MGELQPVLKYVGMQQESLLVGLSSALGVGLFLVLEEGFS
jgi:hypothetical protein